MFQERHLDWLIYGVILAAFLPACGDSPDLFDRIITLPSRVYAVTYDGNGNTSGSVPVDGKSPYSEGANVTVAENTGDLAKSGSHFAGWNTAANGSGTSYAGGATFTIGKSNVLLYAQWSIKPYSVTYNGNGNTGGTVPTDGHSPYDTGETVTVVGNTGNLIKTGYTFLNWNTAANGTGIPYSATDTFTLSSSINLYAQWSCVTCKIFETTFTLGGNLGGASGADAICMASGNYPGTGTYKALIGSSTERIACTTNNCSGGISEHLDWVLHPSTAYTRLDNTSIGLTDANGLFIFPLSNSISDAGNYIFTGLTSTWTGAPDCASWSSTSAGNGQIGGDTATTVDSVGWQGGSCNGGFTRGLYCVEQ